jgi:cyanate lyase
MQSSASGRISRSDPIARVIQGPARFGVYADRIELGEQHAHAKLDQHQHLPAASYMLEPAQNLPARLHWAEVNPIFRQAWETRMSRLDVTEKIVAAKVAKGLKWADVAQKVGFSKEWVTAACLGQMTLPAEQAHVVGQIFGLTEEDIKWLTVVPYKGSLPTALPADPLIYRFYELVNVYGTTFKELIHEEFGDGIMSAIDFRMELTRENDPKGDRVKIVMSGKFLPYKTY